MKRRVVEWVFIAFLLFGVAVPGALGEEMVILKSRDNGKDVTLKCGAVIEIELEEAGGTGYQWELDNLETEYLQLLKVETKSTPKEGMTGSPVTKRWVIKTRKGGDAELRLYYFRPWEGKEKAIEGYLLRLHIS